MPPMLTSQPLCASLAVRTGEYELSIALNGLQYSSPVPSLDERPEPFYFYNRPHVQSLKPEFGPYTGDTFVRDACMPPAYSRIFITLK